MGIRNFRVSQAISRSRIRYGLAGVAILLVAAGLFAFPQAWDKSVAWFNSKSTVDLGKFPWNKPYRLGLDLQGGSHLIYEANVTAVPAGDRADALEGVRDVIERRVNAFGVSEPVVQTSRSGDAWRIIVELAGIKDINQAIKMIGETPILEFKEQGAEAPKTLTDEQKKEMEKYNAEAKKKADSVLKQALNKGDFSALAKASSEDLGSKEKGGELGWFSEGSMVKPFEDTVKSLKDGFISGKLVSTQFGYHIIKRIGTREVEKDGKKVTEYNASHILIKTKAEADYLAGKEQQWEITGLSGKQLTKAMVQFDPNSGLPTVSLEFNDEGKKLFGEITERNVGKYVAIFLDGEPISVPVVNEPIRDGKAVISGNFTVASAKQLVQRLNAGALPVPVALVSQQTVGASLGMDSLNKSLYAGLIGFLAVAIFMIALYRLPGLLAVLALTLYTFISLSIFKMIPVTLSLAGIAGFILSVGMAVDANVLIFERTKEELRRGLSITQAINEGFGRAWLSIRDSNVSSLLTCLILMWFGTSVIKGFAVTLSLGILVSMFSAITVTRVLLHFFGPYVKNQWWFLGPRSKKSS